ncbi:MAG: superoxide dismutase [Flavobacteriales bacterium]|jgi:Fe-Mn family superoxide dismutase|nr:superoxide dismutase [Flavobacteriales bacterium]|tara:strand:- start:4602 stop:5198 length:597 start_codon:yes stop_codon:yes gene_type:complete
MEFQLPQLNYDYNALEPYIDAKTMEIHHSKHHAGYTNNLNNAISGTEFENKSIEDILKSQNLPDAIRNNGGGYYNHCLFWNILSPNPKKSSDQFIALIEKTFGSCDEMKKQFAKAAATRFGSGWAWLCAENGELSICSTPNQDNPLMIGGCGGTPILALDVWEHAYYLNYQNRRPDYIQAFWNIVNWSEVEARYQASL